MGEDEAQFSHPDLGLVFWNEPGRIAHAQRLEPNAFIMLTMFGVTFLVPARVRHAALSWVPLYDCAQDCSDNLCKCRPSLSGARLPPKTMSNCTRFPASGAGQLL